MHSSALATGELFLKSGAVRNVKRILDIGGRDVNGTLRRFAPGNASFISIDLEPGRGVDLVLEDPYRYPFSDGCFDCVVSTSCLEHDRMFWLTILEASRVLSQNGLLYLSVPSQGAYHGYPYDNWRFYPDASLAIVEWSARSGQPLHLIESFNHPDMPFNDYIMSFSKTKGRWSGPYLHEQIAGSYNIRVGDSSEIARQQIEAPGIALAIALGDELIRLRGEAAMQERSDVPAIA